LDGPVMELALEIGFAGMGWASPGRYLTARGEFLPERRIGAPVLQSRAVPTLLRVLRTLAAAFAQRKPFANR
jgi:hypothetical protein